MLFRFLFTQKVQQHARINKVICQLLVDSSAKNNFIRLRMTFRLSLRKLFHLSTFAGCAGCRARSVDGTRKNIKSIRILNSGQCEKVLVWKLIKTVTGRASFITFFYFCTQIAFFCWSVDEFPFRYTPLKARGSCLSGPQLHHRVTWKQRVTWNVCTLTYLHCCWRRHFHCYSPNGSLVSMPS